jgi:DNA invertase Pin-like site-specific DNA recombinase
MKPQPVAYSYLRFSSPQQATGDSIRRQVEATAAWCQRNKVQLDESIKLRDEGVSAFKGAHRKNPDVHALAGFLNAVKSGRVPAGSYLIVESLDRLTREELGEAVELVLSLVNKGVKLVQLKPAESVLQKPVDITALVLAVVELSRGHSESKMKSERVGAAWARKQKEAAEKIVTRRLPCWIDYTDGKLALNPVKAEVVRGLFALSRAGMGVFAIAKKLNAEKVPVIGRTHFKGRPMEWCMTSIYSILTSRAAIGDYVPYKCRGEGRKPQGEPVPGYFPGVVDEATFYAVQKGLETRGKVRGKRGKHTNLFAGLLIDARNGGAMTYRHRSDKPSQIVPVDAGNGRAGLWASFPAKTFEDCVLSRLAEVKAADIESTGGAARKVEVAAGKLAETESLIRLWEAKMDNPDIVDTVAAKLGQLNALKREQAAELAEAQREASSPISEAWGEFRTLADLLGEDPSDELRVKVRSAIRRAVESVTCLFVGKGVIRRCAARVQFVTGAHRDYVIEVRQRYNRQEPTPPRTVSPPQGWVDEAEEIDLRNPADAALVEKVLDDEEVMKSLFAEAEKQETTKKATPAPTKRRIAKG